MTEKQQQETKQGLPFKAPSETAEQQTQSKKKLGRPKKKRDRKVFTAQQKVEAVLAIWTESSTQSEICKALKVNANSLIRWQDQAMQAILKAMEPAKSVNKLKSLSPRLKSLIAKQIPKALMEDKKE